MQRHGRSSSTAPSGTVRPHAVARWCVENGWPVHPLAPGRKTPAANCPGCSESWHPVQECSCRAAGRWCHGFHAATTDPVRIDAWWQEAPGMGVGVACGPARLVVIDVDAHCAEVPDRNRLLPGIPIPEQVDLTGLTSGFDTLALLAAFRQQPNPAENEQTLRVRTPSGGLHIWYAIPHDGVRYRSSAGSSPKVALAWQVDIRADNGYIVAPMNRTPAGTYTPVGPARLPGPLPAWLAQELGRTGHILTDTRPRPTALPIPRKAARRSPTKAHRLLDPLLTEVTACAVVPHGASFTEKLNRAAYTAGGLTAAGHLTEAEASELLEEAAQSARPHQIQRNRTIIDSALAAGATRPLHLQGHP